MIRRRRGLPATEPGSTNLEHVRPDPSQVGGVAEAPFVRLPVPAAMFGARHKRLTGLASDHPMAEYLRFLADVVHVQDRAVAELPRPDLPPADQVALRTGNGMPPLSADQLRSDPSLADTVAFVLDALDLGAAPAEAAAARDRLRAMPAQQRADLAQDVLGGAFPLDQVAESVFVAAAVQVYLARLAAQLDAATVQPVADGVCPCCGGPPVASMVVGWTQASKARYCACGLCGALWNYVRIKCTACSSTGGVSYLSIEGGSPSVGVETCTTCHSYIKHMQQHQEPALDPIADDVASYGLDLLVREDGFRRASVNPLFLIG